MFFWERPVSKRPVSLCNAFYFFLFPAEPDVKSAFRRGLILLCTVSVCIHTCIATVQKNFFKPTWLMQIPHILVKTDTQLTQLHTHHGPSKHPEEHCWGRETGTLWAQRTRGFVLRSFFCFCLFCFVFWSASLAYVSGSNGVFHRELMWFSQNLDNHSLRTSCLTRVQSDTTRIHRPLPASPDRTYLQKRVDTDLHTLMRPRKRTTCHLHTPRALSRQGLKWGNR